MKYPSAVSWFVLSIVSTLTVLVLFTISVKNTNRIDFYPTYIASHLLSEGIHQEIYNPTIWVNNPSTHPNWYRLLDEFEIQNYETTFTYSPWYLWLFKPFVHLPYAFTTQILDVLSAIALVAIVLISSKLAGIKTSSKQWLLVLATTSLPSVLYAMELGQNVLPAVLLLLLCTLSQLGSRPRTAITAFTYLLACAFKPWAFLFAGIFLLRKKWRLALGLFASYIIIFHGLTWFIFSEELLNAYYEFNKSAAQVSITTFNNLSLRSFLHRLLWPDWSQNAFNWSYMLAPAQVYSYEIILLIAIASIFAYSIYKSHDEILAYLSGVAFLIIPLGVSWNHYFVFSIPLTLYVLFTVKNRLIKRCTYLYIGTLFYIQPSFTLFGIFKTPEFIPPSNAIGAIIIALPTIVLILLGIASNLATRQK